MSVWAMPGGVAEFDSTASENYNRGLTPQSLNGGEVVFRGYTNAASNLGINGIDLGYAGNPTLTILPGGSNLATVHKNHNGSLLQVLDGGVFLLRGTNLGAQARLVSDSEFNNTTFRKHLVGGDLGFIDNGNYPEYKDYGTPKAPVVRHVLTDDSPTGNGASLATYHSLSVSDTSPNDPGIRALSNTEYSVSIADGEAYAVPANMENKRFGTSISGINAPTRVTSLTLLQDGSVAGSGTLVVQSGDVLALGNNNAITVANLQPGATTLRPGGEQMTLIVPDADDRLAIGSAIAMPSNGLVKAGYGTVVLTGANSFTGMTTVSRGALRAVDGAGLPAGSNLRLAGGVLESSGTFTRTLGTATGQVQWLNDSFAAFADGGFAANGGPLTVRLNNGGGTQAWGTAPFVGGNRALVLGSVTADNVVDFQNGLNLGAWSGVTGGRRTIRVPDNTGSAADYAKVSGPILGTDADVTLVKEGDGALILAGTNSYRGATLVNAGSLEFAGSLSNGVSVAAGGAFGAASPASNVGSSTVYGAVGFVSNATLTVHWLSPTSYDVLDVKGTLTFASGSLLRVVVLGSTGVQGRNLYVALADAIVGVPTVTGPGGFSLAVEDVGGRKGLRLRPPAQGAVFVVR
jgi:autotransporter-associated beta strand protein